MSKKRKMDAVPVHVMRYYDEVAGIINEVHFKVHSFSITSPSVWIDGLRADTQVQKYPPELSVAATVTYSKSYPATPRLLRELRREMEGRR